MQKRRKKRLHNNTAEYKQRTKEIKFAKADLNRDLKRLNMKQRINQPKKIIHSSWYKFFGKMFKHSEVTAVSNSDLWDNNTGLPKHKDDYSLDTLSKLPIVVTRKRSHFLGMSWKRVGTRPQRIVKANPDVKKLIKNRCYGTYSKDMLHDAVSNWHIVDGSWDTSIAQLQRFADEKTHKLNINGIFDALNTFSHELILPALDSPCFESVYDLKVKWRAQPGFDQAPECATKAQAWLTAKADARILWGYFGMDFRPAIFEWLVGGRWRRNKKVNDDQVESRAVLFNCFAMDLIGMLYAQPLTMAMKKMDAGMNFLGHSMQKLGYERYIAWKMADVYNVDTETMHKPNVFIAIDAKSHDSSRSYKHKGVVMALLRSCFPISDFVDRHFFAITHNLCNLKVVTPGGFTYLFEDGNPSGTPFTSWISTLSNWIDWCCIRHHCPYLKDEDGIRIAIEIIVAGDDTEVKAFVPDGFCVDWASVASWAKIHCSLDIPFDEWSFKEVTDQKGDLSEHASDEAISFLKVSVVNECEGTHQIKHLANKDLCPKTFLKRSFQPVNHFFSLISVHSEDPRLRIFLAKRYFQNVYCRDPVEGEDDDIVLGYRKHIRNESNKANRSYSMGKFFSYYIRGAHPGKPYVFDEGDGDSMKKRLNRLKRNHGLNMYDLLKISSAQLKFEFCGLEARDGSVIESLANSRRFYRGFDARRYPYKAYF